MGAQGLEGQEPLPRAKPCSFTGPTPVAYAADDVSWPKTFIVSQQSYTRNNNRTQYTTAQRLTHVIFCCCASGLSSTNISQGSSFASFNLINQRKGRRGAEIKSHQQWEPLSRGSCFRKPSHVQTLQLVSAITRSKTLKSMR